MPRQMEMQKLLFQEGGSALQKYRRLIVGRPGIVPLVRYELIMTGCSWMPGALGLLLRSKLYRRLLGSVGRNVLFGTNVVLRHPHKIRIGDNVVIDDNCLLDAKGWDNNGITIASGVFVGRNTILTCKNGDITVGENTMLSANCEVFSGSRVSIGRDCEIAAYTYLIGGDHAHSRSDVPVAEQGLVSRGIQVGDNVWLGAGVKVLDGVSIGRDSIVGAGAVVTADLPPFSVAVGVPARVVKLRSEQTQTAAG